MIKSEGYALSDFASRQEICGLYRDEENFSFLILAPSREWSFDSFASYK